MNGLRYLVRVIALVASLGVYIATPMLHAQMGGGQASGFLGAWCAQGDPGKHASISGNGVFLTLTNENGDTSPGNLQGSNQIQAPGWQFVTGTLSSDGSQINWSNGSYWARCEDDNGGGIPLAQPDRYMVRQRRPHTLLLHSSAPRQTSSAK